MNSKTIKFPWKIRYLIGANGLYFTTNNQTDRRRISTSSSCPKDYHLVLGLNSDATKEEIRSKFLELCKLHHPDKAIFGDAKEKEKQKIRFQEVNEAYEILTKPKVRDAVIAGMHQYGDLWETDENGYQRPRWQTSHVFHNGYTNADDEREEEETWKDLFSKERVSLFFLYLCANAVFCSVAYIYIHSPMNPPPKTYIIGNRGWFY